MRVHPLSEREVEAEQNPQAQSESEQIILPSVEVNRAAADRQKRPRRGIGLLPRCARRRRAQRAAQSAALQRIHSGKRWAVRP